MVWMDMQDGQDGPHLQISRMLLKKTEWEDAKWEKVRSSVTLTTRRASCTAHGLLHSNLYTIICMKRRLTLNYGLEAYTDVTNKGNKTAKQILERLPGETSYSLGAVHRL